MAPDILRYPSNYNARLIVRAYLEKAFDLAGSPEHDLVPFSWKKSAKSLVQNLLFNSDYPVELEALRIDIKFKHWQKMLDDRNLAIRKTMLRRPQTVPAKISYQGKTLKSELRLKGDLGEHWQFPIRWSFRIQLKNGASIGKFTSFSLQRPAARQFPFDQLYHYWHQSIGGLAPKFDFMRVFVNGDYWGIMLLEEHMTKTMIELNGYKEAPLFKLTSEDGWYFTKVNNGLEKKPRVFFGKSQRKLYGAGKYRDDDRILRLYSYVLSQFRKLNRKGIREHDIVDLDATARSWLLAMAWGNPHTLSYSNSRFYINPYTLKVAPINTDQGPYKLHSQEPIKLLPRSGIYSAFVKSVDFEEIFLRTFKDLQATLPHLKSHHMELCSDFPIDCPSYDPGIVKANMRWIMDVARPVWFSEAAKLRQNLQTIESVDLSTPGGSSPADPADDGSVEYPAHILAEHYDNGTLRLYNLLARSVVIRGIKLSCTKFAPIACRNRQLLDEALVLKGSVKINHLFFENLQTPVRELGKQYRINIVTERNGRSIDTEVSYTLRADTANPLLSNRYTLSESTRPEWLAIDGHSAFVAQGTWTVDAPLVLPTGMALHVAAGTTLRFAEAACLIVRGKIIAKGTREAPIEFSPRKDKWKGLYILNAAEKSYLSHVRIRHTDFLSLGVLKLTGGVTFYQSDVDISHSLFDGSAAEDALNIVHSEFSITDSVFQKSRSDAFDSDFSQGVLANTVFNESGGDGLDLSGSTVTATDLQFMRIKDKGISVGEDSTFTAQSITAMKTGSAIVSKDGSQVRVDNLQVKDSQGYAAMAYVKKSVYGPVRLEIVNSNLDPDNVVNQHGNIFRLEGRHVLAQELDVDALYSTGQMRK